VILAALISYPRAIILGLLQGVTELFPISSLGHTVILPGLLGWHIHQNDPYFLDFLVATHLATAIVLFLFFRRDWVRILKGIGRSLRDRQIDAADTDARLGWLLVVGTIPAGILGLLLQDTLRKAFGSPKIAASFLIANGVLLFGAEYLRRRAPQTVSDDDTRIAHEVTYRDAALIGTIQSLALIPGFSRSGASMGGGLFVGLSHKDAARFAFLLATPLIGAAALLKLPELFGHTGDGVRGQALVASLCSALTAFLAVKFLMRFFETNTLTPFAVYCLCAGVACLLYFVV
jgi:undecaprenyl-diphosphatase